MKKITAIITVLALSALFATKSDAQRFGAPEVMKHKTVLGGNLGLNFYNNSLYLSISPQVGFRLTRNLEIGTRFSYRLYYQFRSYYYSSSAYHFLSGGLYANYEIYGGIYAHAEYERTTYSFTNSFSNHGPMLYNSVFVGVGYRQYFRETGFIYAAYLYDLLWSPNSLSINPYDNPFVVRIGFCYGL